MVGGGDTGGIKDDAEVSSLSHRVNVVPFAVLENTTENLFLKMIKNNVSIVCTM